MRLLGGFAGDPGGGDVEVGDDLVRAVVALRDAGARERVRLDDVGTGEQVVQVDLTHGVGLREHEQVVVAAEVV